MYILHKNSLPVETQMAWKAASNIAAPGNMALPDTLCSHSQASLATAKLQWYSTEDLLATAFCARLWGRGMYQCL